MVLSPNSSFIFTSNNNKGSDNTMMEMTTPIPSDNRHPTAMLDPSFPSVHCSLPYNPSVVSSISTGTIKVHGALILSLPSRL
jgi:hypothetical protein